MKLIIAGSREWDLNENLINYLIFEMLGHDKPHTITEVVSGACGIDSEKEERADGFAKGVDGAGERWAARSIVPYKRFYPYFKSRGPAGGPIRNGDMAKYGDELLLIWDGESRGSGSMKRKMLLEKKPIYEVILRRHNEGIGRHDKKEAQL